MNLLNVTLEGRVKTQMFALMNPSADGLGQEYYPREKEIIYLSLHCHYQNDSCIKMGSEERHFNVSLTVRDKVTRVSTDHIF